MHLSIFLVTSVAALASAECFTSGDSWGGDRSAALAAAQTLCEDGTLSGDYTNAQVKYACVDLSTLKKVDFTIEADHTVLQNQPIPLQAEDCVEALHAEINGCEHGGHRFYRYATSDIFYGDLTFTSDPNAGNCA